MNSRVSKNRRRSLHIGSVRDRQPAGTHRVVGLRLPNEDQYVGADDGQAEVEQDDGAFRADVSDGQTQKTENAPSQCHWSIWEWGEGP